MAKTMKEPKSKLRENEKVLYSVIGGNARYYGGILGGGESGRFFLTNQRLFQEKLLGGEVRYSIELSEIADCKVKTFWSFVTFPLKLVKCVVLADKNGIVIRKLQCSGFLGSNGKKLSAEMNTALENVEHVVEIKAALASHYNLAPYITLLPLVLLTVLSIKKVPAEVTMSCSILLAVIIAIFTKIPTPLAFSMHCGKTNHKPRVSKT